MTVALLQKLSGVRDLRKILETTVKEIGETFNADSCQIMVSNPLDPNVTSICEFKPHKDVKLPDNIPNVSMPLVIQGRTFGALSLQRRSDVSREEVNSMRVALGELGDIIRHAQINDVIQRDTFRDTFLVEIGNVMAYSLGIGDALFMVVNILGKVLQASRCLFICTDDTQAGWKCYEFWQQDKVQSCQDYYWPTTHSPLIAQVLLSRTPLKVFEGQLNSYASPVQDELQLISVKSLLGIPLRTANATHGCVILQQCDYRRAWTRGELDMVQNVADKVAEALLKLPAEKRAREPIMQLHQRVVQDTAPGEKASIGTVRNALKGALGAQAIPSARKTSQQSVPSQAKTAAAAQPPSPQAPVAQAPAPQASVPQSPAPQPSAPQAPVQPPLSSAPTPVPVAPAPAAPVAPAPAAPAPPAPAAPVAPASAAPAPAASAPPAPPSEAAPQAPPDFPAPKITPVVRGQGSLQTPAASPSGNAFSNIFEPPPTTATADVLPISPEEILTTTADLTEQLGEIKAKDPYADIDFGEFTDFSDFSPQDKAAAQELASPAQSQPAPAEIAPAPVESAPAPVQSAPPPLAPAPEPSAPAPAPTAAPLSVAPVETPAEPVPASVLQEPSPAAAPAPTPAPAPELAPPPAQDATSAPAPTATPTVDAAPVSVSQTADAAAGGTPAADWGNLDSIPTPKAAAAPQAPSAWGDLDAIQTPKSAANASSGAGLRGKLGRGKAPSPAAQGSALLASMHKDKSQFKPQEPAATPPPAEAKPDFVQGPPIEIDEAKAQAKLQEILSSANPTSDYIFATPGLDARMLGRIDGWVSQIEAKDKYLNGHARQVAEYSVAIAKGIGLDDAAQNLVRQVALVHDVGKLGAAAPILQKREEELHDSELITVMRHPIDGAELLESFPDLAHMAPIVRAHHEEYNGEGFPAGLKENEIPIEARIICLANAYHNMVSDMRYGPGMDPQEAQAEITRGAGRQWDPTLVQAFLQCLQSGVVPAKHK
ncbi:MAG: GAF domain-containing protein [Candidatus Obscuribacterales bacterium]|nr:GAF domain-containing protein [Candidatus Obscuribacterales bacterium]